MTAWTTTQRDSFDYGSGGAVVTGNNVSVGTDKLLLLVIGNRSGSSDPVEKEISSVEGFGLTWTRLAYVSYQSSRGHWIYYAMGTPVNPGAITITYNYSVFGGQFYLYEIDETDNGIIVGGTPPGSDAIGVSDASFNASVVSGGTHTLTLPAFEQADNMTFCSASGRAEITDFSVANLTRLAILTGNATTTSAHHNAPGGGEVSSVVITATGQPQAREVSGIALEVKHVPGAPSGSALPVIRQHYEKHLG